MSTSVSGILAPGLEIRLVQHCGSGWRYLYLSLLGWKGLSFARRILQQHNYRHQRRRAVSSESGSSFPILSHNTVIEPAAKRGNGFLRKTRENSRRGKFHPRNLTNSIIRRSPSSGLYETVDGFSTMRKSLCSTDRMWRLFDVVLYWRTADGLLCTGQCREMFWLWTTREKSG